MQKRGLGVVRLSVLTDETTSPERQKEQIQKAAAAADLAPGLLWAEDLDVSATKYSPFERPDLGPYLTDPELIDSYDVLVFWRLDRFVRKVADFWEIIKWCREHGKGLMSATEPLDLDSDWGEVIAMIVAKCAEIEAKNLSERVSNMYAHVRQNERWAGESVPFGYEPGVHEKGHPTLVKSPTTYPILKEIIDRLIAGETASAIARDFNQRGIHSPKDWWRVIKNRELKAQNKVLLKTRGTQWTPLSITSMFKTGAILGYALYQGEVLWDEETGLPKQRYEPLISLPDWNRLQTALADKSRPSTAERVTSPVAGVAFCLQCGGAMHKHQAKNRRGYEHDYLACVNSKVKKELRVCNAKLVSMKDAVQRLEDTFLAREGDKPVRERVYVRGEDHTEELGQARAAMETLVSRLEGLSSGTALKIFDKQIAALEKKIMELEKLPNRPAGYEWCETGETYGVKWERSNADERRHMLIKAGFVFMVENFEGELKSFLYGATSDG